MIGSTFGTGQVLLSMLYFFLFFLWIWLAIMIFSDIFRSRDLSGWGKALWSIFVIILPFIGIFTYLIARGSKMQQHAVDDAKAQDAMMRSYIRDVVATPQTDADQIATLTSLRDQGIIDNDEFQRMKARVNVS
jgi:hypothetical protein